MRFICLTTFLLCIFSNQTLANPEGYLENQIRAQERYFQLIRHRDEKFLQAYGVRIDERRQEPFDLGQSVLDFIYSVAKMTKENRLNDALKALSGVGYFPQSGIWSLPEKDREQVVFDPNKIPESVADFIMNDWESPNTAQGGTNYAMWPDFKIRDGETSVYLYQTPNEKFQHLKIGNILVAAEELAHAVQTAKPGYFVSLSQYMRRAGKTGFEMPSDDKYFDINRYIEVRLNKATWPEKDVFAFLIETFGVDIVPFRVAKLHSQKRLDVLKHFYGEQAVSHCSRELTEFLSRHKKAD